MLNLRPYVVAIFTISFLITSGTVMTVPWQYVADWQKAVLVLNVIVSFCSMLLAYFVFEDEEKIDELQQDLASLKEWVGIIGGDVKQLESTTTKIGLESNIKMCGECTFFGTDYCMKHGQVQRDSTPCVKFMLPKKY